MRPAMVMAASVASPQYIFASACVSPTGHRQVRSVRLMTRGQPPGARGYNAPSAAASSRFWAARGNGYNMPSARLRDG
jgi:hypothetical protein